MSATVATAFAPASVANLAVGFDVLGFAVGGVGDRVRVRADASNPGVRVGAVAGVVTRLPQDPAANTATVAVQALAADHTLPAGLAVDIFKGIPLGSGMGGSAASAVAAVVAANELLADPLPTRALLPYAVEGESVASGDAHADNVAPSLMGGLTAVVAHAPPEVVSLPIPDNLVVVLTHPHLEIETRAARAALSTELSLADHVRQSQALTGFLAGCFANDLELLGRSMVDVVGEPARAPLIPGYEAARAGALKAGAVGFAISGAGPSVFALLDGDAQADAVRAAVRSAFAAHGLDSEAWVGPINTVGAHALAPDITFAVGA